MGRLRGEVSVEAGDDFALVREVSQRVLGMRPFDVQLLGAAALQAGRIVEMETGEGKTLAAVLPASLEALTGGGVHVLTANDYLARRDASWMGPVYRELGLRVAAIGQGSARDERRSAYEADVTYLSANEAGFDFLRDRLARREDDVVQRPYQFGLADEADSILIDEARVPLVIAGATGVPGGSTVRLASLIEALREGLHFQRDPDGRNVRLTDAGIVEEIRRLHASERPVLVGTASVAESERLASLVRGAGVECRVLNARNDEEEAAVIAEAGDAGAVTISTNMAGRGVDIRLGGAREERADAVRALGGLFVLGTNRHEARRIDDQLRGRAGRQGDPGASRFYVSLEDDLFTKHGAAGWLPPMSAGGGAKARWTIRRRARRSPMPSGFWKARTSRSGGRCSATTVSWKSSGESSRFAATRRCLPRASSRWRRPTGGWRSGTRSARSS